MRKAGQVFNQNKQQRQDQRQQRQDQRQQQRSDRKQQRADKQSFRQQEKSERQTFRQEQRTQRQDARKGGASREDMQSMRQNQRGRAQEFKNHQQERLTKFKDRQSGGGSNKEYRDTNRPGVMPPSFGGGSQDSGGNQKHMDNMYRQPPTQHNWKDGKLTETNPGQERPKADMNFYLSNR